MEETILVLFIAGALGALTKDILEDNAIILPKNENNKISLGFLGGLITGGLAGYLIDGSLTTAFMGGYAGTGIFENLVSKSEEKKIDLSGTNEQIIRKIAREQGVDEDLAVRVAKCESSLNEKAINVNTDKSIDRGLFQINSKYHPEVSEQEAFNPIFATEFFCNAVKNGNISWWSATQKCWSK